MCRSHRCWCAWHSRFWRWALLQVCLSALHACWQGCCAVLPDLAESTRMWHDKQGYGTRTAAGRMHLLSC